MPVNTPAFNVQSYFMQLVAVALKAVCFPVVRVLEHTQVQPLQFLRVWRGKAQMK
jgi:hypothetical protein